uniref:Protein kinase domain-containing protein n=1 Tax=Fagus sylvatica TaxID=28930 RepID=A0A2N9HKI4_FAGSY
MCYGRNGQPTPAIGSCHKVLLSLILFWAIEVALVNANALQGCDDSCGDVSIPYPFGTREGCYMNEDFLITCNHNYTPPLAFLGYGTINVTHIWLSSELRAYAYVAHDCYNQNGERTSGFETWFTSSKFPISNTRNKFTAIGCDTTAVIQGSTGTTYTTGCISLCASIDDVVNGSCSGIGCCQTEIPKGVKDSRISVNNYSKNHSYVSGFSPCSYAFVVEEDTYNFTSQDLRNFRNGSEKAPRILNWAIGNQNCSEAKKDLENYACKNNSYCYDSENRPGYWCNCSKGFQGNPYLPHGCRDIDECQQNSNPCVQNCTNLPGVSVSLTLLLLGISWLYWGIRQRKLIKLKEKFFEQNGGIMLRQQLSKHNESVETTRIFTAEELKKATDNYNENRILGQGGQGTVYKGILRENKIVAIKKSKIIDQSQIEQFINEVIILSQVNHRNVVKLLGCCLETQVPMLVYEFVTNGTVYEHLHNIDHSSTLQWQLRLQIAVETAGALSYLHFAASTPIIHRDIKSTNVLLDNNYTAKVSDFGASRLVPLDHTQLTTLVQGTLGYLDPEYFQSSQLTEKSDVYSFGVLLAELLTGKKALSFDRPEEERNLAMHFVLSMKENRLFEILDPRVVNGGNPEQLMEVAMLVKRCLRLKGEERPTMKEVAIELEGLKQWSNLHVTNAIWVQKRWSILSLN